MGSEKYQNHCIDCDEPLANPDASRCRHCTRSANAKTMNMKKWADPDARRVASEYMRTQQLDANSKLRRKSIEATNRRWADHDFKQYVSELARNQATMQWADPNGSMSNSIVTRLMKQTNSLEAQFKDWMDIADVNYVHQYKPQDCRKIYDFYLVDYHALLEIDGMNYHYSDWAVEQRNQRERDAEKDKWAYDHGFTMVRIPECDLGPTIVEDWLIPTLQPYYEASLQ